jgi:hypothetical protein
MTNMDSDDGDLYEIDRGEGLKPKVITVPISEWTVDGAVDEGTVDGAVDEGMLDREGERRTRLTRGCRDRGQGQGTGTGDRDRGQLLGAR